MDIKTGIKTTEFWLTVIIIVGCFVLLALGKLDTIQDALGVVTMALGVLGYNISRGMVKKNGGNNSTTG